MKGMYRVLTLTLFLLTLIACGHFKHGHGEHHKDDHKEHKGDVAQIELNGSEKWEMDNHTRKVIQKMRDRVQRIDFASMTDNERQKIGGLLKMDIKALIQGCTMDGKAHDALHEYMMPLMKAVNNLADCGCIKNAENVRDHLEEYPQFFF